ncbi:Dam family site-specific DNA-(adenine-N6)-methyltransferase [Pseudoalteromonas piscicida]|uniref:Dam family site-specific DNA-(adenine-N6)-methyltransferase n=1 Tax=Pseudoalteromonas piscicida TaxID=43662 RepID=UPI001EFCAD79|nr:Dam family site-specific DNA-(adenine-N6)-methyltransferase [Pseudoalteromonas piscicida]MCG9770642.1 Dam family site-specific DNA-(adenine-N6)-methyltransferase [Pseudoalteromonas piscicida]
MANNIQKQDMRSPLKWPGGKKRVLQHIRSALPISEGRRLVEPFVGGGSVFLNLDFKEYLLCDTNNDLISLYKSVKKDPQIFKRDARILFTESNNSQDRYYRIREQFNGETDPYLRSIFFLYLNRHGYNGLCRYNMSGGYNVPFGRYKKPYFPEVEIDFLAYKLERATFIASDFEVAFNNLRRDDVVYCDPPYSPINRTSNFTAYSGAAFSDDDQIRLVQCAIKAKKEGIDTLISNHLTPFTENLYSSADYRKLFSVQRSISQNGKRRNKVEEILALYSKKAHLSQT